MKHLNRPLGYEIASLLIDSKLSFPEIKRRLPYDDVNDNEVNRILTEYETDAELFTLSKVNGDIKHTFNSQVFSDEELATIHDRAEERINDTLPDKDRSDTSQTNQAGRHMNLPHMESQFI
ncbi:hypothetical protein GCM10008995_01790 [Halobellus salinus]|uniref:Uncharacterized protein n=2 Tax=Halobellus salinus TaxID=931585 RepID=A0A830EBX5_9EURY|nr:hypothetical protein GCM10008995_01790 [Halobellus salinus]